MSELKQFLRFEISGYIVGLRPNNQLIGLNVIKNVYECVITNMKGSLQRL